MRNSLHYQKFWLAVQTEERLLIGPSDKTLDCDGDKYILKDVYSYYFEAGEMKGITFA